MQLVLVLVATLSLLLLLVALLVRIRPNPMSEITPFSNRYPSWRSSPMIPSSSKPLQLYGIYFLPPVPPSRAQYVGRGSLVCGFDPFLIYYPLLLYILSFFDAFFAYFFPVPFRDSRIATRITLSFLCLLRLRRLSKWHINCVYYR